ncbi:bacteriophage T4 gp5 trimerisation domain-containing protein [Maridesulfovibrio sp.]|uniref:bacteriophage T4 gp5 trimerisation domain-containing protein n=1 Tax=Maridesulfovibrio sp. TaxID=2795000 RepID=UPI002A189A93|nr:baseplate assembly protein [Maridesulfovibrio sp.]
MGTSVDLMALMKRIVELVMPDLRAYYRVPRKGKIVATYPSNGRYWADVQPLRNDDSIDESEPVIPKVEIPIMWAGPKRGVVCPPLVGTHCDITYYDGDPDFPRISNFRWHVSQAPDCEVGAYIIQQIPGVHIKIDAKSNIIHVTPANRISEIGSDRTSEIGDNQLENIGKTNTRFVGDDETITVNKNKTENVEQNRVSNITEDDLTTAANWTVKVEGLARVEADEVEIVAKKITRQGEETVTGHNGEIGKSYERTHREHEGSYNLKGNQVIDGDLIINGNLKTTGNSNAGSRSGGPI